ncbi:MAG: hypothetical protein V7K14_03740 [Nostoc sp.]|uniref:hypothetical protein n=1 Tax=Nostoc sp. TaxID=1180 RepID=UPI002FFA3405
MMLHLSTAKYNSLLWWKTYLIVGKGTPGEGGTPLESIQDWIGNCEIWMEQYRDNEISLSKFAELIGISIEESKQILVAENIEVKLGILSKAELEEDIKNA